MSNRLTAKPSAASPSVGDVLYLDGPAGVRALDAGYITDAVGGHNGDPEAHLQPGTFELCIPWVGVQIRDAAGTGAVAVAGSGLTVQVRTGTTANSKAAASSPSGAVPRIRVGADSGDGNFSLSFLVARDAVAANGVARLVMGRKDSDTTGPLSAPSYAVEFRSGRVWVVAWDTALREVNTGFDLTVYLNHLIKLVRTSTGFRVFVDGVERPSLTVGAIGAFQANATPRVESQNNASAAENRYDFSALSWRTWL